MKKNLFQKGSANLSQKLSLKMKLSILFTVTALLSMQANDSYAQRTKITLNLKNVSVARLLDEIESKTDFRFVYQTREVNLNRKISVKGEKEKVTLILDRIFQNTETTYKVIDKQIFLRKSTKVQTEGGKALFDTGDIKNVQFQINGTITDEKGVPLSGANIIEKGTTNGTQADFDGNFSLNVASANAVLKVSYIGFATREVVLNNQTIINITLEESANTLDEIVVVGYGTQKKSDLTGSVSSISLETIEEKPDISIEQVIQGRVAGVQVTQQSGAPGGGISINIRGPGSVQGGNEPLYVVDGFPIYSSNDIFNNPYTEQSNALSFLDPSNIKSIEILKDASATAIYGSRGANGVVLVTTKEGTAGKTKIEFKVSQGIQDVSKRIDLLSTNQMEVLRKTYEESINQTFVPLSEPYASTNTDWQDLIFQAGLLQDYSVSISGGNEKTKFYLAGNLINQKGVIINSGFNKGALRLNLNHTFNNKFSFSNNLSISRSVFDSAFTGAYGDGDIGSIIQNALMLPPFFAPYDEEGNFKTYEDFPLYALERMFWRNGLAIASGVNNERKFDRLLNSTAFNYQITNDLNLRISGGIDYSNNRNDFSTKTFYSQFDRDARIKANVSTVSKQGWVNENILTYSPTLNDVHEFKVLAGFTQQSETVVSNATITSGYPNDELGTDALQLAEEVVVNSNKYKWDMLSWLGRFNYTYKNRYLLTASIRADGSSKFGANSKWGVFPSAALGWRISEEKFLRDSQVLSNLKLRLSYGITGNQEIGTYRSISRLNSGTAALNGIIVPSIFLADIPDENLSWEETKQFNIGLDIGFFKERLAFNFDAYKKVTENVLLNLPQPLTSGIDLITKNIGSLENKGLEFSLASRNFIGKFQWKTLANVSILRNKILDLNNLKDYELGTGVVLTEGEPLGVFYGYKTTGLWQLSEAEQATEFGAQPGDIKYLDLNGDGNITPNDRTYLGSPFPNITWGLTNNFSYGNVDLSIFFRGQHGSKVYNVSSLYLENLYTNSYAEVYHGWSESNPRSNFPRPTQALGSRVTDRNVEDASFLRLENIKLGYHIPMKEIEWLKEGYFFVSGQNLLTISDYRGYDPEVNSLGQNNNAVFAVDQFSYPKARTITLGTRISF